MVVVAFIKVLQVKYKAYDNISQKYFLFLFSIFTVQAEEIYGHSIWL